jgi:hypothetical protein
VAEEVKLLEEEPYQLNVRCEGHGEHTPGFFCCLILEEGFPILPPPRVQHPAVDIGHLNSCEADSITYLFLVQGSVESWEIFTSY